MGADIHGYWEIFHPEFNRWVMFKPINDTRKYSWFGIIAGVRGEDEPRVPVIMGPSADPSRAPDGSFSRMWVEYCKYWGRGLHSHAIVPWHSAIEANEMLWISDKRHWTEEDGPLEEWEGKNGRYRMMMSYHEDVPDADFLVESVVVDTREGKNEWGEDVKVPIELPMGVTLGDIIGSRDTEVIGERVRMVVAFDN